MAETKKAPAAAGEKTRKPTQKSPLRKEIERVAKLTGLTTAAVSRHFAGEKKKLAADYKAAQAALVGRVAAIVSMSLRTAADVAAGNVQSEKQ